MLLNGNCQRRIEAISLNKPHKYCSQGKFQNPCPKFSIFLSRSSKISSKKWRSLCALRGAGYWTSLCHCFQCHWEFVLRKRRWQVFGTFFVAELGCCLGKKLFFAPSTPTSCKQISAEDPHLSDWFVIVYRCLNWLMHSLVCQSNLVTF